MSDTVQMLTTLDNPFNPFTQFDEWYSFDVAHGYNTCGLIARIAMTSNELSDVDNELEVEKAIDVIANENITGNYLKVEQDYVPRIVKQE